MIGASSAESTISKSVETKSISTPPAPRRVSFCSDGDEEAEEFRCEQNGHRQRKERERALRVEARPDREDAEFRGEIFRPEIARLEDEHDADEELQQPERRGQIAEDAGQEMLAARPMEAFAEQDAAVLQIALAPTPVADGEIDQRRRAFLIGAADRRKHVDRVAGAAHQGGLDEVVAQDVAAPGRAPAQVRQAAMRGEGLGADDRVMAPVIAVAAHPFGKTHGDHRPIDARGELLNAREKRVAVDDERQRLDDAGVGIGLHRRGEADDRAPRHQAVGVEHDHMLIGAAPAADEFGDIARLAARVLLAPAIEDARAGGAEPAPQRDEGALLGDPDVGIRRVGEKEPVEIRAEPRRLHILEDRLQRREDAARDLVVDGHHDDALLPQGGRHGRGGASPQENDEADDRAREGERDPGKVQDEEREQRPFQGRDAADVDDPIHFMRAIGGQHGAAAEGDETREPGVGGRGCGDLALLRGRGLRRLAVAARRRAAGGCASRI